MLHSVRYEGIGESGPAIEPLIDIAHPPGDVGGRTGTHVRTRRVGSAVITRLSREKCGAGPMGLPDGSAASRRIFAAKNQNAPARPPSAFFEYTGFLRIFTTKDPFLRAIRCAGGRAGAKFVAGGAIACVRVNGPTRPRCITSCSPTNRTPVKVTV
jgi:hypothetical protein